MKKKIALVLTAAMAVGTLAGCGSSTAQTTTSEQASAQTTDKTEGGADTVENRLRLELRLSNSVTPEPSESRHRSPVKSSVIW